MAQKEISVEELHNAIGKVIQFTKESGASILKLALRDRQNKVLSIVCCATGEEAPEVEKVVAKIQDRKDDVEGIQRVKIDYSEEGTEVVVQGNMTGDEALGLLGMKGKK